MRELLRCARLTRGKRWKDWSDQARSKQTFCGGSVDVTTEESERLRCTGERSLVKSGDVRERGGDRERQANQSHIRKRSIAAVLKFALLSPVYRSDTKTFLW